MPAVKKLLHHSIVRCIAALIIAAFFLTGAVGRPAIAANSSGTTQAQPPMSPSDVPGAPTAGPYTCTIEFIAVFNNRVVLRCVEPQPSTIIFDYAFPTDYANSAQANRLLTLMNTAYALGKQVNLYYLPDESSNPPGCSITTCRRLDGIYLN